MNSCLFCIKVKKNMTIQDDKKNIADDELY